jgi:protein kinase X
MASLLKAVFGDPKAKRAQVMEEIAVNRDMTLKTLFSQQFSLLNLDLLETFGTGTFGRVRLVKSLEDDRYYALKVMKKARIAKLKQLEHVQNEVRIMSHVRSPLMVELYAVFQDDNSLYMLLEYIPGGELFSHLRRQEKFAFAVYQFYAAEIVAAIQILHELNVMYRDIKPENILIHKDGHIRLSDFGFAKILDTSDRTFTLCGTPEYLAPEIIQGVGHGTSVDWWALGVLVFELLAGYAPFSNGDEDASPKVRNLQFYSHT